MASNDRETDKQSRRAAPVRRRITALVIALLLFAVGGWCYRAWNAPPDLPPVTETPFLNATPRAKYVGSHVCTECHAAEHASYLQTYHSTSFGEADAATGFPDGEFYHSATGRTYAVNHHDDQAWHEEILWTHDGEPEILAGFPVRYQIGSGHHAASFAVEVDEFLFESPLTWYASLGEWAMSPGYDTPRHPGFQRPIAHGCLFCHTGNIEPIDGSYHRFKIHEQTIGCERCHGPGSLHVEFRESTPAEREDVDLTIVHPERLSRERQDDLCAQCHLAGEVAVDLRGRKLTDFRPGLALNDFRAYYGLRDADQSMTVVGHVEQMQASRCYQESESLTCISCHSLHGRPAPESRLEHYRSKCLNCHTPSSCGINAEDSRRIVVDDDCVACHMPESSTDIVHVASTHHRIGIFGEPRHEDFRPRVSPEAVPLNDLSHLPLTEQQRCLGLAYVKLIETTSDPAAAGEYASRARRILEEVRSAGVKDPELDAALAQLLLPEDSSRAVEYAQAVLLRDDASPHARSTALYVTAHSQLNSGDSGDAIGLLRQVNRIRRHPVHWRLLSQCYLAQGALDDSLSAMQRAVAMRPADPELRLELAALHERLGDDAAAEEQRRIARLLRAPGSPPGNGLEFDIGAD